MDAGFFRGTSVDQDGRFSDKEKKLMKTLIFEPILNTKVNMTKINFNTIKPWISKKICEILGFEDEVVIQYIYELLETDKLPNPQKMQMQIAAFLQAYNARIFMKELWSLLVSAQNNPSGIPEIFIKQKKDELQRQAQQADREISIEDIEAISQKVAKMVPRFITKKASNSPPTPNHGNRKAIITSNDHDKSFDGNISESHKNDNSISASRTANEDNIPIIVQNVKENHNQKTPPKLTPSKSSHQRSSSVYSHKRSISASSASSRNDYKRRKKITTHRSSSSSSSHHRRRRSSSRRPSITRKKHYQHSKVKSTRYSSDSSDKIHHSSHRSNLRSKNKPSKDDVDDGITKNRHTKNKESHKKRHHRSHSDSSSLDKYDRGKKSTERSKKYTRVNHLSTSIRPKRDYEYRRNRSRPSPEVWVRNRLSSSSLTPKKSYNNKRPHNNETHELYRKSGKYSHLSNDKDAHLQGLTKSVHDNKKSLDNNKHPTISPPKFTSDNNNDFKSSKIVSLDSEAILRQKAIESMMKKARAKRFHLKSSEEPQCDMKNSIVEYTNNHDD